MKKAAGSKLWIILGAVVHNGRFSIQFDILLILSSKVSYLHDGPVFQLSDSRLLNEDGFQTSFYWFFLQVKFHINSLHKLVSCKNDSDDSSRLYLNMEQLNKTLMSLYSLYAVGHFSSKNEAEFYSFYILLNLRPHSRLMVNTYLIGFFLLSYWLASALRLNSVIFYQDKSFSLWLRKLSPKVIKSEQVSFARNVLRYCNLIVSL